MIFKSSKLAGFWFALILMMGVSVSASAIPNPIAKAGSASKTVLVKTYDGAKSVAKVPVRFTKDAASGAWSVSDRLVSHVKSAF